MFALLFKWDHLCMLMLRLPQLNQVKLTAVITMVAIMGPLKCYLYRGDPEHAVPCCSLRSEDRISHVLTDCSSTHRAEGSDQTHPKCILRFFIPMQSGCHSKYHFVVRLSFFFLGWSSAALQHRSTALVVLYCECWQRPIVLMLMTYSSSKSISCCGHDKKRWKDKYRSLCQPFLYESFHFFCCLHTIWGLTFCSSVVRNYRCKRPYSIVRGIKID